MKIVVLAGGISTERDVSLCSGRNIYEALKGNGHGVVLVDLFLGLPEEKEPLDHLFTDDRDWSASVGTIAEDAPDIAHVKALRPNYRSLLGPNVLKLCELSDMVFLALHGEPDTPAAPSAWIKILPNRCSGDEMFRHLLVSPFRKENHSVFRKASVIPAWSKPAAAVLP